METIQILVVAVLTLSVVLLALSLKSYFQKKVTSSCCSSTPGHVSDNIKGGGGCGCGGGK